MLNKKKTFCVCIDVYKIYENNVYDKIFEVLSTIKNKKLKVNHIVTEKYKDMLENPDFEQDYYSRTAKGIYKNGHDSIRILKWICYDDRSHYENNNYFDLFGSVSKCLNEISQR